MYLKTHIELRLIFRNASLHKMRQQYTLKLCALFAVLTVFAHQKLILTRYSQTGIVRHGILIAYCDRTALCLCPPSLSLIPRRQTDEMLEPHSPFNSTPWTHLAFLVVPFTTTSKKVSGIQCPVLIAD